MVTVGRLAGALASIFPWRWAEPWDNSGLTIGTPEAPAQRILIALDVTVQSVAEAHEHGCSVLLSHHPFPWRERRRFDLRNPENLLLASAITDHLNLLAVHTNLDAAPRGHAARQAALLGLADIQPLRPAAATQSKLLIFAPPDAAPRIRKALAEAGVGYWGDYAGCSDIKPGIGRFLPGDRSHPWQGEPGREHKGPEERIEVVCPSDLIAAAVEAARAAHPYEEMAYETWALSQAEPQVGLGRIGRRNEAISLRELAETVQRVWPAPGLRCTPDRERLVSRVALIPGAGGDLIDDALAQRADVLIGGEFSHHQIIYAQANGLSLIDAGHFASEIMAVDILREICQELLPHDLEILIAHEEDPLAILSFQR